MQPRGCLINNGKVLIAGCSETSPTRAELYDPVSGTFAPTAGSMVVNRCPIASAPLPDGRILFAGPDASAEIYDPSTDSFSSTGNMHIAREGAAAAPLPDGTILISGGGVCGFLACAEIYDPASGSFSFTGNMTKQRVNQTAIALPDGEVLEVLGSDGSGIATSAELYHPSFEEFFSTRSPIAQRLSGTATLLASGQVLLAGGEGSNSTATPSAELYTPSPAWIPFSSFSANVQIHGGKKPSFNVNGTATPAANGSAVNPSTPDVYLWLGTHSVTNAGTYSVTIPAGSFVYDPKHRSYTFSGVIQNVSLEVLIQQLGGTVAFSVTANGFDLSNSSNPMPIELHLGSDVGITTIAAKFVS